MLFGRSFIYDPDVCKGVTRIPVIAAVLQCRISAWKDARHRMTSISFFILPARPQPHVGKANESRVLAIWLPCISMRKTMLQRSLEHRPAVRTNAARLGLLGV